MKSSIIALLIICFVSLVISLPLLKSGLFTIHDDQQVARLFLFDKSLRGGQFPVRWVDELGFGFGYPLFVFYPPLAYMLGEIFHLTGFGYIDSVKLVFFTSIILSGLGMYVLSKEYFGKLAGTVSAIFYMLAPYRALDIYVRGALAESLSFVWPPLILWSYLMISQRGKSTHILIAGALLALLMITHNLMFLPFILLLLFFSLFLFLTTKDKKRFCLQVICSLAIAAALSAFFWVPALLEKKYTIVDDLLLVNLADYKIHFVYPQQLWNWTWGFGGSAEGIMDGISFKIGKVHVLISVFTFLWAFYYLFILKFSKNNFILKSIAAYFTLFVLSAFMTTMYSRIIWEVLPPLAYLQFPWRFLAFTSLFSSLLVGGFIYLIRVQTFKLIATLMLFIIVLIPNLKLFKPQFYRLDLTDETATSKELINWEVSRSSFEYIPKGVALKKNDVGANTLDISKQDIGQDKLEITSGNAQIKTLKSNPHETSLEVYARTQTLMSVNIFDFPNWSVYLDNQKITHTNDNKFKLISFTIPEGTHKVTIKFENTKTRALANMISLLSLLALVGYLVKKWQTQTTN